MKATICTSIARVLAVLSILGLSNIIQVSAIQMDPTQPEQVRDAAKQVASDLVGMYANTAGGARQVLSGIPGLLKYPPYYWWEAGAMFGTLIEYWYYTGDDQYNELVREGILYQIGEAWDFMPANQSKDEGNDDQLFWAFTAMTAAELNFPDPPPPYPGWLALAQSVMNQLISRWSTETCSGGLRWQIYQWLNGYNYKNTAANGGMFQLGARLAKYTGNETYREWAETAFEWLEGGVVISDEGRIFDGTDVLTGCEKVDKTQWTYNYGIMIGGAAYMYNLTNGSPLWRTRLTTFLNHTSYFFPSDRASVMSEICEPSQKCNIDQWSFKAYLSRWLATAAQIAPYTAPTILPLLHHSATFAAKQCDGSSASDGGGVSGSGSGSQSLCGSRWYLDTSDRNTGVGQQMSALSVIQSCLIKDVDKGPVTGSDGGTSVGNPAAGTDRNEPVVVKFDRIDRGDQAGASILTILLIGGTLGSAWWITKPEK